MLPGWRNGRRNGLKIRFPLGSEGSTPSPGTIIINDVHNNSIKFPKADERAFYGE